MPKRYLKIKKAVGGDAGKAARIYNASRKPGEAPVTKDYEDKSSRSARANRKRIGR